MAEPRLTTDLQTITACESTTGWTVINSGKVSQEADIVKEGTYAISLDAKTIGGPRGAYFNFGSTLDLRGKHLFYWLWAVDPSFFDSYANGGIRIHVRDNAGNYGEWRVGGNDVAWVGGGYRLFAISVDRAFDYNGGSDPNRASLQYFGAQTIWAATALKSSVFLIDIIRYGNLLKIAGGGPSDPIGFQDIIDKDIADDSQYGFVINNRAGVFEVGAQLVFEPGPSGTYFRDENFKLAFSDNPCHPDYLKIKLWATGSAVMDFQFGDVVGTGTNAIAIGGSQLYPIDDMARNRFLLDFTHPDIDALRLYGMQVQGAGEIRLGWETGTLGSPASEIELVSNVFDDSLHVSRDLGSDYPLMLGNVIANPSGTGPSLKFFDDLNVDDARFRQIAGYGYGTSNATGTVTDYRAINPYRAVTITVEGQLWQFVDPMFAPANGYNPHILWQVSTGTFEERFTLDIEARSPAGAPYQNARVYLYDTNEDDFHLQAASTDITGSYVAEILTRDWINGQTGTASNTHGPFVERVFRFGQSPFETNLDLDSPLTQTITLVDDEGVAISEAAADLVSGTVYEHGTGTAPANLIGYDNGTIAFTSDDVVVGAISGATGTVRDQTGDTTDGTLFLVGRNATPYQDGENLEVGGVPKAVANLISGSGGFDLDYHWEVRASNDNLSNLYGWQASKSAKAVTPDWVLSMVKKRSQLFRRSGGDYWSLNPDGQGVFLSERGAGNVLYLTADNGWQWTPPQQYTLTLTGLVTGSGGSEVRIYQRVGFNDTGDELAGIETAGTTFQYSYEHGGSDIPVIIVVFHTDYLPVWQHYDLTAADASLPINQGGDRVFYNPP